LGEKDYNRLAHSLYSILDDPQKDQIFATISLYFADQYPEAFITWLLSVPPSPKLHAALEVAVGRLSKRNLEMALTAIQELGDEKQVEIGWNTLCLTICDDDPSAALRYSDGAGYGLSARLKGTIIKEWAK